jgi:hypothetical protein
MPGVGVVGRLPPEHGAENTDRIARTAMKVAICRAFCGRYYCGWSTLRGWLPTATTNTVR